MIIARGREPRPAPDPLARAAGRRPIALERLLALAGLVMGLGAWIVYLRAGLVLSHYDAKAHLVVARRVIDNITPGWQQVGAVWLPLPHLINLLPTQIDLFYRTGAFASLVSIACLGVTVWATARLVLLTTRSRIGAGASAALLLLNPNLIYLHTTPMTEPLLLAFTFTAVVLLYEWLERGADQVPPALGWVLFAAMWTRYEAWLVVAAALAAAVFAMWRGGLPASTIVRRAVRLAVWPAAAAAVFLVESRITVGAWFVTGGFYVPDPTYAGRALKSLISIWWGTHRLSGYVVTAAALGAAALFALRSIVLRRDAALLLPVALLAGAALPFYAFYEGHPYRIRYMIPSVAACALFGGCAIGLAATARRALPAAFLIVISLVVESPPWDRGAPILEEAQWDVPASQARRAVTTCLEPYSGEKIMASMGSLAHYMQELSHAGFDIADFVHEGTGEIWNLALQTGPQPHAGWMLVEEQAEGGDELARRIRADAAFARGMVRVCEGGGVALYRRETARDGRGAVTRR